jgi:hypothetical protein
VWLAAASPALAGEPAATGGGNPGVAAQHPGDERQLAWEIRTGYFVSIVSDRHIDVAILEAARDWRYWGGLELQVRGGIFHSTGIRTDAPLGVAPDSTATGVSAGGGIRYYPLDLHRVHLFLDASVQILVTPGQQFPAGGSGLNGFLRGGAGVSYDFSRRFTLEAIYQVAHVSNASGGGPQNPGWSGQGGCLSVRLGF